MKHRYFNTQLENFICNTTQQKTQTVGF